MATSRRPVTSDPGVAAGVAHGRRGGERFGVRIPPFRGLWSLRAFAAGTRVPESNRQLSVYQNRCSSFELTLWAPDRTCLDAVVGTHPAEFRPGAPPADVRSDDCSAWNVHAIKFKNKTAPERRLRGGRLRRAVHAFHLPGSNRHGVPHPVLSDGYEATRNCLSRSCIMALYQRRPRNIPSRGGKCTAILLGSNGNPKRDSIAVVFQFG